MSTTTIAAPASAGRTGHGLAGLLANTATVTGRNLHRLVRVPTLITFATAQPVMFVLLYLRLRRRHPPTRRRQLR